jgi:hypothetical protein
MRLFACISMLSLLTCLSFSQEGGYVPATGYVPDSKTAVSVAEAVLIPVYGTKQIESERPFKATLKDGVWTVAGTLRCPDGKGGLSTQCDGGVAVVRISSKDARVIYMMHGQ